jgi:hypothetical protein
MVAFVRDEREANYLRLQIAYNRVCDIEREISNVWLRRPESAATSQQWLSQLSELNAASLCAHRTMSAALRDYTREIANWRCRMPA